MRIVDISISGFHNVSYKHYDFDELTYIFGKNGAGKSTILQAIQYCLLGYIPGTNKTSSAIFKHANSSSMEVTLTLEKSNTDDIEKLQITRSLTYEHNKFNESFNITPEIFDISAIVGDFELPILNFNEFLSLTSNKQKELLASIIPITINPETVNSKDLFTSVPQYQPCCDEYIYKYSNSDLASIDGLKKVNEEIKSDQATVNSELKRLISTIQSMIFYDDYQGDLDIENIKNSIASIQQARDEAIIYESKKQDYESKINELEKLSKYEYNSYNQDPEYLKLLQTKDIQESKLESLVSDIESKKEIQENIKAEINLINPIINSNAVCPYTQETCLDIQAKLENYENSRNSLHQQYEDVQTIIDEYQNQCSEIAKNLDDVSLKLQNIQSCYELKHELLLEINKFENKNHESVESLSDKLQKLTNDLEKASANIQYETLMKQFETKKLELESQLEFLKAVNKLTGSNGLQTSLLKAPFENLEKSMNLNLEILDLAYLGAIKFIVESKANSFDFGVIRNDTFIPFQLMSSGEKCVFVTLFMISLLQTSNSYLSFVLIDDLFDHLDETVFKTIINNVNKLNSKIQLIIAGVNDIPDNCNILKIAV